MTERELQMKGVDVVFGGVNIDEKVKVKGGYANRILEFPSFELSFVNRAGVRQDGWFLSGRNITDYYALIAVFGDFEDENGIDEGTIDHLNVLLVRKRSIEEHVKNSGVDLRNDIKRLSGGLFGDKISHFPGMYVKLSEKFSERPVNLVVRRDILLGLPCTREFTVRREYAEDAQN